MKKSIIALLALASTALVAQNKKEDIKAIKNMCGCYEIEFNYSETFQLTKDSTYVASPKKKAYALEWVKLVEEQPNKLVLQHLLVINDSLIIKHWRQDWLYQNTKLYEFHKDNTWKFRKLQPKEVKNQWTQKVYQVDDSPRYEGTASWIHNSNNHYWMNTTDAPLPRREYTIRADYNVLKRRNIHHITSYGWLHEQDNIKIDRTNNDFIIAQEKGMNTYTKVEDSKCNPAKKWWKKNQKLWENVRNKWETIYSLDTDLHLKEKVDNKSLFKHLFALPSTATKAETDKIIESFIIK